MSSSSLQMYKAGDEGAIRSLFRTTYGRDMDDDWWQWRFKDNASGESIIQLAWDGHILASHYAITQAMLSVDGVDVRSGLDVTTMTHPDYRGRGLFRALARAAFERSAELGIATVWGFPNRNSHRGYVQDLSWLDIWEIPTFRWRLPESLALPTPSCAMAEVDSFDERFDALWEDVKLSHYVMVRRDHRYLTWRYIANPMEQYRILISQDRSSLLGYAVFKRYNNELQVVDLLTKDDVEIGRELVLEVARIARQESLDAVSLWLNVTNPLHRLLERLGFENDSPITYFAGLILRPDVLDERVYDYRNWHLTMGDSDVY